jgi:hypothetical protein
MVLNVDGGHGSQCNPVFDSGTTITMGVRVRVFQLGGRRVVNSFADNFNRADTTLGTGFGPNWLTLHSENAPTGHRIDARVFNNQALWGANVAGGNSYGAFAPIPALSALEGRSQFSEFTFISNSVGGGQIQRWGPTVLISGDPNGPAGNGQRGYGIQFVQELVNRTQLVIWDLNSTTGQSVTLLVDNMPTAVANDVWRISYVFATTTVTVFRNGVSQGSAVNAALTRGIPGVVVGANNLAPLPNGGVFDNYACGPA